MNELNDDPQQLFNQLDHRGFNLLMIAAENGRDDEVTRLLTLGFDVNSSIGPHTAASLAYQRRHFNAVLILLNANSKFPPDFNAETTQHAELIAFAKLMNQFYEHLFGEETRELQTIITEHPHLRYFYNIDGHSAAFESLNNMIINCYELFVQNNILLSPDEDFNEAIVSLTDDQKEQVSVIHERYAVPLPNNHLMIIHGSLFVIHDETEINRLNIAQNAINFLNDIPLIQPILKLIARAGCFKIIFDFNRESTQFMNPKSGRDTRGLFCTTRHIYIAARNLLNEVNRMEVYGTIAHELTHFAMDLVYNNNCKPYKEADRNTIGQEFHQILLQSRQQNVTENIITAVWNYPEESQFAELIVRVPHMMAFYSNNQVILNLRIMQFQPLFNVYTTRVLPDIVNKIPTINAEVNQMRADFYDKTIKKVSKWRKTAKFLSILAPIGILITALLTYSIAFKPDLKFNELSPEDQDKVFIGNVKFLNTTFKFHELYNKTNTQLLNSLDSTQLRRLLNDDTLDLSDLQNSDLQNKIILIYSNMTQSLQHKVKEGKVNFQGEKLRLEQIIGEDENSKIFEALNAEQIRKLLSDVELNVGKAQEIKTEFYIERDFIDYDIEIETKWNANLEKEIWIEEALKDLKNFDQISSIAVDTKMILLSDCAGAGKTTSFKHLSVKLKDKFPHYWISYIDLKRHLKVYQKFEQNIEAVEVLQEILSITDELEIKIFTKLFESDRVILLYDGVDEIAPKFKDFFIKFIENVRKSTNNQQWIATRPQHMKELRDKFNQIAYKLLPYKKDKKIELIENVLKYLKIGNVNADNVLTNIDSISFDINSPLMLQMMTELYVNDKTILTDSNLFSLYNKMIELKKQILGDKGEIVNEDRDNQKAKLTIWQVHQIYAVKLIFKDGFKDRLNDDKTIDINEFQLLKRWKKEKSKWTPEAISRYGLLYVDNWNTNDEFPDFVHRSFAEFFAAQFAIQDLYELNEDDEMSEKEIEMRTKLLIEIGNRSFYIDNFILSFIDIHESKKMHKNFFTLITSSEMQKLVIYRSKYFNYNLISILTIDERFLKEFRFNGNLTFFQYAINVYHLDEIEKIVDIYKRSLGTDWILHNGFLLNKNFSVPKIEKSNEILNSFDQLEIPKNYLLKFFNNNFYEICKRTSKNSVYTQLSMRLIQNNFQNNKNEFLKAIMKKIRYDPESLRNFIQSAKEFLHNLEEFFQSDEQISVNDIKDFFTELNLCSLGMKNVIKSYEEKKFTKSEIQQIFIKHSVEIIYDIITYEYDVSIEDFITFLKELFNVQSERSQLKKFLEARSEKVKRLKDHTVLSYLNQEIKNNYYSNLKQKENIELLQRTLMDLAKTI